MIDLLSQTLDLSQKLYGLISRLDEDNYAAAIWAGLLGAAAFWIVHWRETEGVQAAARVHREQALALQALDDWHIAECPKDNEGRTTAYESKPRSVWRTPKIIDLGPNDRSTHEDAARSITDRKGIP